MKRLIVFLAILSLVVLIFPGTVISGGQKEGESEPGKIKIQFMSDGWESAGGDSEYFKRGLSDFHIVHPNVEVEVLVWAQDQRPKMLTSIGAGGGPDVLQVNADVLWEFAPEGYLDEPPPDVLKMVKENYYPSTAEYLKDYKTGKIWGLANYSSVRGCFYNMNVLEEAGFPRPPETVGWTWNEVINIAQKLTKVDPAGKMLQEGLAFCVDKQMQVNLFYDYILRMHGKGATFENCIIDEENHRFLAADNGLGARSLKMLSDPYLVYKVSDTQFMKSDEAFANNKLAILCGEGNWAIATFDALNPQIADKVEVRMMPPLSKDGDLHEVGCCGTVVINANSKQKRIAWDLAKALHSEEALYTYAKTLGIAVENKNAMERFGKEDSRFNYAVKSMQYGVKANPHATLISQLATPILDMVQLGKLSSEEGIAQLNQQITQELEW